MARIDSAGGLAHAITQKTGVRISERSVWAIESGRQTPSLEQFVAIVATIDPNGGLSYFADAFRGDIAEKYLA